MANKQICKVFSYFETAGFSMRIRGISFQLYYVDAAYCYKRSNVVC